MGVTGLWPILSPVKKHRSLRSLQGQTLAVDLSIWVCESQGVRQMHNRVLKPHLRNLFFRVSTLLQLGVKLVFVVEGEAPVLKHGEMGRRLQTRHTGTTTTTTSTSTASTANSKRKFGRSRLNSLLKECCELLDALGVPYIQSHGEAESTCAALNAAGLVDACISDDGDCFLYGAKVVYKNFTIDSKDPHVESFSMEDVTSHLALTRERLVALALLLGCDYFPAGVPGVGETRAAKLMTSIPAGVDVLQRFREWKGMTSSDCMDSTELCVWRKALKLSNFPPQKVIEEFLKPTDPILSSPPQWYRPCIEKMMRLGSRYLEWPEVKGVEKVLPLVTLWDQLNCCDADNASAGHSDHRLRPYRIVKRRVRQGVPCFEVEWENNMKGVVDGEGRPLPLVTVEQEQRFQTCYPELVDAFHQLALQKRGEKSKRSRKTKAEKAVDTLSGQLDSLTISSQSYSSAEGPALKTASYSQPPSVSVPNHSGVHGLHHHYETGGAFADIFNDSCADNTESDARETKSVSNSRGGLTNETTNRTNRTGSSGATINRSLEYVPLSERLKTLNDNGDANSQKSEIVELDDSYTYIPLSQRLKARLGSQRTTTSFSVAMPASQSLSSRDDSPTYVPLSRRLKTSLDGWDKALTCPSFSTESETFETSSPVQVSEFQRNIAKRESRVEDEAGSPSVVVIDDDDENDNNEESRHCGNKNTPNPSVFHVATESSSNTDNSIGRNGYSVQASGPNTVESVEKCTAHDDSDSTRFHSENNSREISAGQTAKGNSLGASRSVENLNAKKKQPATSKNGGKKKAMTSCSQHGRKSKACSQRLKMKMTELLENWSDSETSDAENGNSVPIAQKSSLPVERSHTDVSSLQGMVQLPANKVDTRCFSEQHVDAEYSPPRKNSPPREIADSVRQNGGILCPHDNVACDTQSCNDYALKNAQPENSTPFNTNKTQQDDSSWTPHSPALSLQDGGDSYISDGHFTLHHSLFTSVEESANESRDIFADSVVEHSSEQQSACSMIDTEAKRQYGSEHPSCLTTTSSTRNLPNSAVSSPPIVDQQTSDNSPAISALQNQVPKQTAGMQQSIRDSDVLEDENLEHNKRRTGEKRENSSHMFSCSSSRVSEAQCSSTPSSEDESPLPAETLYEKLETSVEEVVPSLQQSCENAQSLRQSGSEKDDCCLLPLSQRLGLKKRCNTKALSSMNAMF